MKRKPNQGRCFVQFPAALITVLSDTAMRILIYAIDRQALVKLGIVDEWQISPVDVENQFKGKVHGYSRNTVRDGFRELKELGLIEFRDDRNYLNTAALNHWMFRNRDYEGGPKSGRGGCQNLAGGAVPNSGTQENKSLEKKSKREEKAIPPAVKTPLESFADVFGDSTPVTEKTDAEKWSEFISRDSAGEAT